MRRVNIRRPRPQLARRIAAPALLGLLAHAAAAQAQVPPDAAAQALALASEAARSAAPPQARVVAEAGPLDARLKLAPCAKAQAFLAQGMPVWGRTRVGVRCVEGASHWRVFVPVTIQVWAPALVATAALPAGTRLVASQLQLAVVDWADGRDPPYADAEQVAGRALTHGLAAGQAPRGADLRARQWFELGETVRIEASGDGFSAVAEGRALTPGLEGQEARVRTENGRVLVGRPIGENRIEVRL